VTGPASDPENSYLAPDGKTCSESMGPTCDAVIVRELFTDCIESSRILGIDDAFRGKLETARGKLPPLRIGRHGQLQEWMEDFEDAIPNHRHMTHLLALYPYEQITARKTPELARAARVSMERRSKRADWEDVEWSRGNLINFYARLLDGEAALDSVRILLSKLSDKNLMTVSVAGIAGAPENIFAIDGNTSGTNGIAEMLLQSHSGEISLLPALPKAWAGGKITGMRARGGYGVDIVWKDGRLTEAVIHADHDGTCTVRTAEPARVMQGSKLVDSMHPEPTLAVFTVSAGESYRLSRNN
jgi:alpha-L-fucosidase 2